MSKHVVVIGGVALGPKAACRLKRLEPDTRVTLIDASKLISYGGCGIPYYISGDVSDHTQLQTTSFHMVRDEPFFKECKDFDVITEAWTESIDRKNKQVTVRLKTGEKQILDYDKLVIATGSSPRDLKIPGQELPGAFAITNLNSAIEIKEMVSKGDVGKAVIVGAGFIGLEMAEALADMWGIDTTVIEIADQVLPGVVGPNMAGVAQKELEKNDVSVLLGEFVQAIEGDGKVQRVRTNKQTIDADLVILSVGVVPNSELAAEAGLAVSPRGGIQVGKTMQTSDPDIYAGGDCVEIENLITGKPAYFPLGSMANRQGRIIGTNLAGGRDTFDGAVGSFAVKIFDYGVAGAGLSIGSALREGFDAFSAQIIQFDHSHFYPEKDLVAFELVVERGTGRVLGVQGLGSNGDGVKGRVDAVAATLKYKPTVKDIGNLEVAYAPPFSSAMDVVNTAANAAENMLAGRSHPVDPITFAEMWNNRRENNLLVLDTREQGNAEPYVKKHPDYWKNIPQGQLRCRLDEVPRDRQILLVCNTGGRSYESQLILEHAGIHGALNLQGGMGLLTRFGLNPAEEA